MNESLNESMTAESGLGIYSNSECCKILRILNCNCVSVISLCMNKLTADSDIMYNIIINNNTTVKATKRQTVLYSYCTCVISLCMNELTAESDINYHV